MKTSRTITALILLAGIIPVSFLFARDFYDINTINTVELIFEQSNWDELLDQLYADGEEERLMGTAIVNGITYDSVGVRYKGNSSYNAKNGKNPLNIKLDYIIKNQEHENYGTLKLSNGFKDPSFVRETLSYEIARTYFPASLSNYAKVTINGSTIGLYTSNQDVDKHFLRTHYYSDDQPFFKGELAGKAGLNVWGYLGEDSSSYRNYYEIESDDGWADLIEFLNILNNDVKSIENVLSVDRHLWMLAFDILMVNLDAPVNFGHNYYLYKDGTGRFSPIIWDLNENFGIFTQLLSGGGLNVAGMQRMDLFLNSTNEQYPIIKQIFSIPTYKKMFVAHMKTIIEDYFANGQYRIRALEIQDIIDSEIRNDPNFGYSYSDFKDNIDNSITGGVGSVPGRPSYVGITELMDVRVAYLNSAPEFIAPQPVITNITHNPSDILPHEDVWITAEVQTADIVQLAYRTSQKDMFNKIDMFDDGIHNDTNAGDDVYGVSVSAGSSGIQYYIYAENQDAAAFSPNRAEYTYYSLETAGNLVINEFMASNDATVADQDGEFDDWIELYNNSPDPVDLTGYFLSDDADDLPKWTFPDTSIAAGDYLIVWADSDGNQSGLHTNFKLSASGESIYLTDPDFVIIDEVEFSNQSTDISMGRYPNGTGSFDQMQPTVAGPNESMALVVENHNTNLPGPLQLHQNFPNPFNPKTSITYSLSNSTGVELTVMNLRGERIKILKSGIQPAGTYEVMWDGTDEHGITVTSGIYICQITAGLYRRTGKMIFCK